MGEKENVVSFNTALDVKYHHYILDFLSGIDMENSMVYLPVTIHDPCVTQEEYIEYLYNYLSAELSYLIDEVAHSDPKLWKRHHDLLKTQVDDKQGIIRFCIRLSGETADDIEIHELVTVWDSTANCYVLIQYNFNHESLVSVATFDYLNPEIDTGFESPITIVKG